MKAMRLFHGSISYLTLLFIASVLMASVLGPSNTVTANGNRWGQPDEVLAIDSVLDADRTKAGIQPSWEIEKYEPLGYSLPVGDVNDMFQVFTDQINACGGIRGRKLVFSPRDGQTYITLIGS